MLPKNERNRELVDALLAGELVRVVATRFSISHQRVLEIFKREFGGSLQVERAELRKQARQEKRDRHYYERWGS